MKASKETMRGEGPAHASVMLIGQNPGREEIKQNRPFIGRSGRYLNGILQKYGIRRETLYLTAVVKESTPGNRKPTAGEIDAWMPVLEREIRRIQPRLIVLMGRVAWKTPRYEGIDYMETYHPAAAMRFPKIRQKFERDIKDLSRRIQNDIARAP